MHRRELFVTTTTSPTKKKHTFCVVQKGLENKDQIFKLFPHVISLFFFLSCVRFIQCLALTMDCQQYRCHSIEQSFLFYGRLPLSILSFLRSYGL